MLESEQESGSQVEGEGTSMYIQQHAFSNILRNRGRNILVGAIILVIATATVTALMINSASSGIIDDYRGRFASEVVLMANMERLRERAMAGYTGGRIRISPPTIPADQYLAFGESEHLHGSFYTAAIGVNSIVQLTVVDARLGGGLDRPERILPGISEPQPRYTMKLLGNQFGEFAEGIRATAEGRMPENPNECIISIDLAELNGLAVGDTLHLTSHLTDENSDAHSIYYSLTIAGTYYDATDEYAVGAQRNAYTNRRNEVLTGYETVVATLQPGFRGMQLTVCC